MYWPGAVVDGDERLMLTQCWKVKVKKPERGESAYSEVVLWVGKSNGAVLKSEGYAKGESLQAGSKPVRRAIVRALGASGGMTVPKQVRLESPKEGAGPVYIDIDVDAAPQRPK